MRARTTSLDPRNRPGNMLVRTNRNTPDKRLFKQLQKTLTTPE